MIVFHDVAEIPAGFGPSAVAIGKFDGVHAGHRAVIERLIQDASAGGMRAVVVTFDRNPLAVLRPEICPPNIVTPQRKLDLLEQFALDGTLMLHFDEALAALTAQEFVERVLVDALQVRTVLVGEDFRFGRGGAGTPELLREWGPRYGFTVDVVADVEMHDSGKRVSSSWIRELLSEGRVAEAAEMLGRPVDVRGAIVGGAKRGRALGFPTANLATVVDAIIPADGVYAGWLNDHVTGIRYPAAISVGTNPTFDDVPERQVEAYVLDRTGLDLYGHDVTLEFTAHLRGMVAYTGVDPLVEQIRADVEDARRILLENP